MSESVQLSNEIEAHRWRMIEVVLRSEQSYAQIDFHLRHLGVKLEYYAPRGYNDGQVAKDSDGLMSDQTA